MEKIFSAAEPQVAFAKPLPQTKPTRPHQSKMLSTRFSSGLLIFSEDGEKESGGNERGRVKVGDSHKKLLIQHYKTSQRFVVANRLTCEYNPRPSVVVDDVIFLQPQLGWLHVISGGEFGEINYVRADRCHILSIYPDALPSRGIDLSAQHVLLWFVAQWLYSSFLYRPL